MRGGAFIILEKTTKQNAAVDKVDVVEGTEGIEPVVD